MIIESIGEIAENLYILGHPAVPIFLLDGDKPVIFDAGFTCLGETYVRDLKKYLRGRRPNFCFLTHVHFDHCGAVSLLQKHYPQMKIAASKQAKEIINRPNAVSLIRELNIAGKSAMKSYGVNINSKEIFQTFEIDMTLDHGDRVECSNNMSIQVIRTPGHTWDCLSYYIPEQKLLISSEAGGQIDLTGYMVSDCLADYGQYLNSLKELNRLDVEILCPGHIAVYTGKDAKKYLQDSLEECERFRMRVEKCINDEKGDLENVKTRIKAIEYDNNPGPKQPEPAYLINLEARILAVKKQMTNI